MEHNGTGFGFDPHPEHEVYCTLHYQRCATGIVACIGAIVARCVRLTMFMENENGTARLVVLREGFVCLFVLFSVALRPNAGHGLLILEVSRSHTTTYHNR